MVFIKTGSYRQVLPRVFFAFLLASFIFQPDLQARVLCTNIGLLLRQIVAPTKPAAPNTTKPSVLQTPIGHTPTSTPDARFLQQSFPRLHTSNGVNRVATEAVQSPAKKIDLWTQALETRYSDLNTNRDQSAKNRLKASLIRLFVIKYTEIPESYYETQNRIHREQGRGDLLMNDDVKKQLANMLIQEQSLSLEVWIDYMLSPDSAHYPVGLKYWSFMNMIKLSKYKSETNTFATRGRGTVAPFPELNAEALSFVMSSIQEKIKGQTPGPTDTEYLGRLENENFNKLYGRAIHLLGTQRMNLSVTAGTWVKYTKGSDGQVLRDSLQGKNTGWCTSQGDTAHSQLTRGDFYVYYSNDHLGQPTNPRIAIRMDGAADIGEIRGIGPGQEFDSHIVNTDILDNKLSEFGNAGEIYKRKSQNMKVLTLIENKNKEGTPLDQTELRLLYELDAAVFGFGWARHDPRLREIRTTREAHLKQDLSEAFSGRIRPDQISTTPAEFGNGTGILLHYGSLHLNEITEINRVVIPRYVYGNFELNGLTTLGAQELPKVVRGNFSMDGLETIENLRMPEMVLGSNFKSLKTAKSVLIPSSHRGHLRFDSLRSVETFRMEQNFTTRNIVNTVYLPSLKSAGTIEFPPQMPLYSLNMSSLQSIQYLTLPKTVYRADISYWLQFPIPGELREIKSGFVNTSRPRNPKFSEFSDMEGLEGYDEFLGMMRRPL